MGFKFLLGLAYRPLEQLHPGQNSTPKQGSSNASFSSTLLSSLIPFSMISKGNPDF